MTRGIDTVEIARQLACCAEDLDHADQDIQLALFRALAQGEAVQTARLVAQTGLDATDISARLQRWHGVHTDDIGRIVAFQGLSTVQTPHRLHVDGRTLYAWCAWDTLFLPELIGRPAEIESTCPTTGKTISLHVEPDGPTNVSPPQAVLSFLLPASRFDDDAIQSFCNFIHFFTSPDAAHAWTARHPGTFITTIQEGFDIGQHTNAARRGHALRRAPA
jgi:alkylmercury lyase